MNTIICLDALRRIRRTFEITENDIGSDGHLSRFGMNFATHSYEIKDAGHLCVMTMKAFRGLMTMETIVISPTEKDLPLFNIDYVRAFGKETLLIEVYDTQLEPLSEELREKFETLLKRDADLPDKKNKPHWYDEIRYPFCYGKSGKNLSDRFAAAWQDYLDLFLEELVKAPVCDREAKSAKNREFAEKLAANKGPAVDTMRSLFGEETMRNIVLLHMYGLE